MQEVSQEWKNVQKQTLVPESFVEITMNVGDPESQADARAHDNGHIEISNVGQTVDETEKKAVRYATLEPDIWVLDGTFEIVPDVPPYGDNGYIGDDFSKLDGTFSVVPIITIRFSKVFSAIVPGLSITWATAYNEWADTFKITAFQGETIVSEKTVNNNKNVISVVSMDIQGYDKITIEILKWCLSGRRARVESILVGIEKTYTKHELISYHHNVSINPLSAELPKTEIKFEITNLNGEYNPENPTGAEKYLMERQAVHVRYGYKIGNAIEWIKAGTFYTNEWETPQNGITASFTARDLLEFMNDTYSGDVAKTLYELAELALKQAELPLSEDGTKRWILDESLKQMPVPLGKDLSQNTIAEILQLVANAACCVLYQDRSGIIHIQSLLPEATDYSIDQNNSYEKAEIKLTKQLKSVDVNNGTALVESEAAGEIQKVDNPLISEERAQEVGQWVESYLKNRKILSGNWRADPRMDALDRITVRNQFSESIVLITELEYTYKGAFRGSYEGRGGV